GYIRVGADGSSVVLGRAARDTGDEACAAGRTVDAQRLPRLGRRRRGGVRAACTLDVKVDRCTYLHAPTPLRITLAQFNSPHRIIARGHKRMVAPLVGYEGFIVTGAPRLAYRIWPGPAGATPLVLLHGLTESSAAWGPVAARLAQSRLVIAWDARG